MQKLKGLWIPAEILLNEDLSDKEKIISDYSKKARYLIFKTTDHFL